MNFNEFSAKILEVIPNATFHEEGGEIRISTGLSDDGESITPFQQECEGCEKSFPPRELDQTEGGLYCESCQNEKITLIEDEYGVCFDFE